MAQDATGTPTSQGIPKYNTAADSPSGKGFNAAMDAIDALLVAKTAEIQAAAVPTGTIAMTGRSTAPTGWELCQGQELSRTTESALFAAIGTVWGVGNGTTTFNVPNFKGRVPVGVDTGQTEFDTINEQGGAKTHTLSSVESGQKAVTTNGGTTGSSGVQLSFHPNTNSGGTGFNLVDIGGTGSQGEAANSPHTHSIPGLTIPGSAATDAHNNLQPYVAVHYIIKK